MSKILLGTGLFIALAGSFAAASHKITDPAILKSAADCKTELDRDSRGHHGTYDCTSQGYQDLLLVKDAEIKDRDAKLAGLVLGVPFVVVGVAGLSSRRKPA